MPGIFISYRRADSCAYAGRVYDHLVDRFGEDRVFMDVDSIEPGADFIEVLQNTVGSCDVLIAVIGRQWLTATDADGRRLDHPEDLVRIEVSTALNRNVRVIPALVGGAQMPASHDLPEVLAALARRNAVEISDTSFVPTLNRLIESLERIVPEGLAAPAPGSSPGRPPSPPVEAVRPLPPAAPVEAPLANLAKWQKWLLLYRPYSAGGILCRLLFFTMVVLSALATLGASIDGSYKDGSLWGGIGFMCLSAVCLSAGAQWFDKQALKRSAVG
jgi:TIR domain